MDFRYILINIFIGKGIRRSPTPKSEDQPMWLPYVTGYLLLPFIFEGLRIPPQLSQNSFNRKGCWYVLSPTRKERNKLQLPNSGFIQHTPHEAQSNS
jgi:hypothetical protein